MRPKSITNFLFPLCLLLLFTQQLCPISNLLQQMYQSKITISSMYKDASNYPYVVHNYVYTYPLALQNVQLAQTIISFHSIQWSRNNEPTELNFQLKKYERETVVLILLSSRYLIWKNYKIGILLNNYQYRSDIFMGDQLTVNNLQQKITNHVVLIPSLLVFSNYAVFITGIQSKVKNQTKPEFYIDVRANLRRGFIQFSIEKSINHEVKKLEICFLVYRQSFENVKKSEEIIFNDALGTHYRGLKSDIPVTQFYFFGISGFRFTQNFNPFSIHFDIVSQYVLHINTKNLFDYLKITYFGISPHPLEACKKCQNEGIIYSEGWNNYCVNSCSDDSWLKIYDGGGRACVKCPKLLNMSLPYHKSGCDCASGFFISQSRCIFFMDIRQDSSNFEQFQCLKPNSIRSQGICQCKPGYFLNQIGDCITKCGNGLWDKANQRCRLCPSGTYVWEDLFQCRPCTPNCSVCENYHICAKCRRGYIRDSDGHCVEECGDGFKIDNECDDGNRNSGDGCSSSCEIENGYSCETKDKAIPSICIRITYEILDVIQLLQGSSLILDCILAPTPTIKYSETELQKMIMIAIEDSRNIPSEIYYSQDQSSYKRFRIVLLYINGLPREDFHIQIRFVFPDGSVIVQVIQTIFFNQYSFFFSIRDGQQTLH